jgi:hypothetical protein
MVLGRNFFKRKGGANEQALSEPPAKMAAVTVPVVAKSSEAAPQNGPVK